MTKTTYEILSNKINNIGEELCQIGKENNLHRLSLLSGQLRDEKATLFYTKFIKCFLLRADSLSDWGLVVKTAVNAMMIPPVNVVLCFKG